MSKRDGAQIAGHGGAHVERRSRRRQGDVKSKLALEIEPSLRNQVVAGIGLRSSLRLHRRWRRSDACALGALHGALGDFHFRVREPRERSSMAWR